MNEFLKEIGLQLSQHEWLRVGAAFVAGFLVLIVIEIVISLSRWGWRKARGLPPTVGDLQRANRFLNTEITTLRKKLGDNHERFRNIAAGWQSIAIGVGVIAGGFWTVTSLQRESAELQYQKLQTELTKRTRLTIALDTEQLTFPTAPTGERIVKFNLSITRGGNWTPAKSYIDLENAKLRVTRISRVEPNGTVWRFKATWDVRFETGSVKLTRANVVDGSTRVFEAIQSLPGRGLYAVTAEVPYSDKDKDEEKDTEPNVGTLTKSRFFYVK